MDAIYEIKFDRFAHQIVAVFNGEVIDRESDCSPKGHAALALRVATKLDEWFN